MEDGYLFAVQGSDGSTSPRCRTWLWVGTSLDPLLPLTWEAAQTDHGEAVPAGIQPTTID